MPNATTHGRRSRDLGRRGSRSGSGGATASALTESVIREILGSDYGKGLEARGIKKGVHVKLFAVVGDAVMKVWTAKLSTAGDETAIVQRKLHLHKLPQTTKQDLVIITGASLTTDAGNHPYPSKFKGGEGPPEKLCDLVSAGLHAWDTRMIIPRAAQAEEENNASEQPLSVPRPGRSTSPVLKSMNTTSTGREAADNEFLVALPPQKRPKRSDESPAAPRPADQNLEAEEAEKSKSVPLLRCSHSRARQKVTKSLTLTKWLPPHQKMSI